MAQVAALAANSRRPAVPQPEPGLTPGQLIARARAMRETLRAQQDESDARGTYSPAMHEAFLAAGFYRITQPRLFGGYEFDLGTYYRVMLEISRGHPGVGWCLALAASHAFEVASHWPEQAQYELFGNDGHFIAPHRAPADGHARAGGRRLPPQRHLGLLLGRPLRHPLHRRRIYHAWRRARGRSRSRAARSRHGARRLGRRQGARHARERLEQRAYRERVRARASRRLSFAGSRLDAGEHGGRHARHAAARQPDVSRPACRARFTPPWWCRSSALRAPRSTNSRSPSTRKTQSMPRSRVSSISTSSAPSAQALTLTDAAEALDAQGLRNVWRLLRAAGSPTARRSRPRRTCGCGA